MFAQFFLINVFRIRFGMRNSNVPSGKEPVFCLLHSFLSFKYLNTELSFNVF